MLSLVFRTRQTDLCDIFLCGYPLSLFIQILSQMVLHNPKKPDAICIVCSQRITTEDRYEIIDQIMHRYCFKCALCGSGLM